MELYKEIIFTSQKCNSAFTISSSAHSPAPSRHPTPPPLPTRWSFTATPARTHQIPSPATFSPIPAILLLLLDQEVALQPFPYGNHLPPPQRSHHL